MILVLESRVEKEKGFDVQSKTGSGPPFSDGQPCVNCVPSHWDHLSENNDTWNGCVCVRACVCV